MHKLKILRYNNRKWPENGAQALPKLAGGVCLFIKNFVCLLPSDNKQQQQTGTGKCPDPANSIEIAACGCDLMRKCVCLREAFENN